LPLSSPREVVGPIGRCVRDAAPALALDALTGFTMADPKTVAGIGRKPPGGYVADLKPDALRGERIGTHGPGRRNLPLSEEATALYRRALGEIEAQGAILVEDPFAGSGFADLRAPTVPGEEYDARGLESLPYDLDKYLERLGPDAAIKTFAEFAAATKAEDPFAPAGVLSYVPRLAAFNSSLADPTKPPDMSGGFVALREQHLSIFNEVFARHRLDAAISPQMREQLAAREAKDVIHETTVSEINIPGLPGVTVPARAYASGSPFNLIAIGLQCSEAQLLGIAFAYEQATRHRKAPTLMRS
jgi:Asp-tRNA(Asn)/Glu-tRNA(Gln) amidotransferase A subunit family amidase